MSKFIAEPQSMPRADVTVGADASAATQHAADDVLQTIDRIRSVLNDARSRRRYERGEISIVGELTERGTAERQKTRAQRLRVAGASAALAGLAVGLVAAWLITKPLPGPSAGSLERAAGEPRINIDAGRNVAQTALATSPTSAPAATVAGAKPSPAAESAAEGATIVASASAPATQVDMAEMVERSEAVSPASGEPRAPVDAAVARDAASAALLELARPVARVDGALGLAAATGSLPEIGRARLAGPDVMVPDVVAGAAQGAGTAVAAARQAGPVRAPEMSTLATEATLPGAAASVPQAVPVLPPITSITKTRKVKRVREAELEVLDHPFARQPCQLTPACRAGEAFCSC